MKIRIKGNSLRLRLIKTEVKALCEQGYVSEKTSFAFKVFTYALQVDDKASNMLAKLEVYGITVILPKKMVENWDQNDQISLKDTLHYDNGESLQLLVEKDFTCLDERGEDESDNYPNPKMLKNV